MLDRDDDVIAALQKQASADMKAAQTVAKDRGYRLNPRMQELDEAKILAAVASWTPELALCCASLRAHMGTGG